MRELRDVFNQLIKESQPRQALFAEVVSYESDSNTVTVKPTTDSDLIENVSLDSQGDETKGFFAVPKIGSDVLVDFVDNIPFVRMYSEVDSIVLKGQAFGGLIKIDSLQSQWNNNFSGVKDAISVALQSIDGQLITLGQAGGSYSLFVGSYDGLVQSFNKNSAENTNVKHG